MSGMTEECTCGRWSRAGYVLGCRYHEALNAAAPAQPFEGPEALLRDEQAKLREAALADLERWAAERTHVFAGAGYRTVRAQAATAEIARRGLKRAVWDDDEALLRAVEKAAHDRGCEPGEGAGWSERAAEEFAGAVVGDVMRAMKGRANPTQVKSVALAVLRGEEGQG